MRGTLSHIVPLHTVVVPLYPDIVAAKKYIARNHQQKWTGVVLSFLHTNLIRDDEAKGSLHRKSRGISNWSTRRLCYSIVRRSQLRCLRWKDVSRPFDWPARVYSSATNNISNRSSSRTRSAKRRRWSGKTSTVVCQRVPYQDRWRRKDSVRRSRWRRQPFDDLIGSGYSTAISSTTRDCRMRDRHRRSRSAAVTSAATRQRSAAPSVVARVGVSRLRRSRNSEETTSSNVAVNSTVGQQSGFGGDVANASARTDVRRVNGVRTRPRNAVKASRVTVWGWVHFYMLTLYTALIDCKYWDFKP